MKEFKTACIEYNRGNIPNARKMRKNPTIAEEKIREDMLRHRPL